ncbi:hypothetical protein [Acrocarpospora catenulata]|uniref:hypothetical protein n=1 Tax=Acrocarpospora catenulata TaxID=2836182 RepID=UPI001BDA706B|nr:hypothetical protein [Acrocarpospora catenulata]
MSLTATTTTTSEQAGSSGLLAGLDLRLVETGSATEARRCSTDNGCDTVAGGDC